MSKKRTSDDASLGEETYEHPNSAVQQQESNSKRARHIPASDKTLEDIPTKILTLILAKAVAMEVIGMKLAKRVWNDKADLVINRLKDVSLRWSSILATDGFLTQVHAILDGAAQVKIRMEILHQQHVDCPVFDVTTLKEEIYMISKYDRPTSHTVDVYTWDDMITAKDVIAFPGELPENIEACNVSNCVYVLCLNVESTRPSIQRISKGEEHQFSILPWIVDLREPVSALTVSPNGNLIVPNGEDPVTLSIYNAIGSLVSSADIHGAGRVARVIPKSNGNLVLVCQFDDLYGVLTEIDKDGRVQRQYSSEYYDPHECSVNFADEHGRILITEPGKGMKLLDTEFNQLDFVRNGLGVFMNLGALHYNSETDEVMSTCCLDDDDSSFITTFCFTEA